jgi:SagB-type dehydrogenase family enzyme
MSSKLLNDDTSRGWAYHNSTKHSEFSIRSTAHYLDWANQPLPLKIYTTIDPIPLPRDADQTGISALSAIADTGVSTEADKLPTLNDIARLLYFSAGITKKRTFTGGEIYFRAASCTGALYEFELYLVCGDLPGLTAGVYHFGPGDYALRRLRDGDYRGVLTRASAGEASVTNAPIIVVCTGTYWRNAWKYRTRTYRHFGWDNGTILANMLAMAAALQLPARVVLGFVDADVNALLDLHTDKEVAFSLVTIGNTGQAAAERTDEIAKLGFPTVPLSQSEIDYPELQQIHQASSLQTAEQVAEWRKLATQSTQHAKSSTPVVAGSSDPIERVILRRGSTRKFYRRPITRNQLSTILGASTQGIWPGLPLLNETYLIINAVDGLTPGAYFYDHMSGDFDCLREGNFRNEARHLGLQQELPGDAAADVFFLADLNKIFGRMGNRGYRAVQLEAGILGGKMYLAAYALHLGATGLTFFDDDVSDFFSPHAKGKSAVFLMAFGKSMTIA